MKHRRLEGIIPALVTPFNEDGKLNYESLEKHVEFLIDSGVDALYPLGTTGEFPLLSFEERKKVAEIVIDIGHKRLPVVIQVGDDNPFITYELISHAMDYGADGVAVVTPYYYNFSGEELFEYYKAIAKKFPNTPIYLYNIPQITGVIIPIHTVEALIVNYDNIWGIKDSSGNYSYFLDLLKLKEKYPDFAILTGADKYILSTHQIGADGNVSGFANCFPEVFVSFRRAFGEGDEVNYEKEYKKILTICDILKDGAVLDLIKACGRIKGLYTGYTRRPLKRLPPHEEKELKNALLKSGLL